jgi:flavin-dependent thymidylate synthase
MRISLAGFNVDREVLRALQKDSDVSDALTPEVLAAAYARISRSPRGIEQLRKASRKEVEKARRSNRTIIFDMGHHSIAEHAVFNFDIMDASRMAMEAIEHFRLCSYTEKSQRYVTLKGDYVVPPEITGSSLEQVFRDTVACQNALYREMNGLILKELLAREAGAAASKTRRKRLEGRAKEDARYILPLATSGQLGMTINARNLELLLRRFASHELEEVRNAGRLLHAAVGEIAPSILLFYEANPFEKDTSDDIADCAERLCGTGIHSCREMTNRANGSPSGDIEDTTSGDAFPRTDELVRLLDVTPEGDIKILSALLHSISSMPYRSCREKVMDMTETEKRTFYRSSARHMEFYDRPPREFEHAHFTFELVLSASCFAQLKRHRMLTITHQEYDPSLGVTVPPSITGIHRKKEFGDVIAQSEELHRQLRAENPCIAPYILTNAHRRRVLVKCNLRELYHISRLREDSHAQWEIRSLSASITRLARHVMPITTSLLGGKDRYHDTYRSVFGSSPAVPVPEEG